MGTYQAVTELFYFLYQNENERNKTTGIPGDTGCFIIRVM